MLTFAGDGLLAVWPATHYVTKEETIERADYVIENFDQLRDLVLE